MIRGYVIADIHFGAISSKDLYKDLRRTFLKQIREDEENIDLVVIAGDLLDHKISFNSEISRTCINFIMDLYRLAKKKDFKIRILKGTKNHDLDQLNNFLYLEKRTDVDFKIINVLQSEVIDGYDVLYIPEEYMEDPKSYYNFGKLKFDICFLHGTFNHVEFTSKTITSEKAISTAPIFSYEQFKSLVRGPVICGHIHIHSEYKKKIFYVGSFERWKFGEEEPKGYCRFILNEDNTYEVEFIKNKYAKKYVTVDIDDVNFDDSESLEKKIDEIKKYKAKKKIDHLRLNVNKNLYENLADLTIMKKFFTEEEANDIKLSISNNSIIRKDDTEEDNELEKLYSFALNNEYGTDPSGIAKTISKYSEIHDNIKLSEKIIEPLLIEED